MPNKGYNSSKITISLKKNERQALIEEAERRGVKVSTLCAAFIRRHIKTSYGVTERAKRGSAKETEAKKATETEKRKTKETN